ncbi:hypothetical protein DVA76_18510, partial [Acinetobacter baumannii]
SYDQSTQALCATVLLRVFRRFELNDCDGDCCLKQQEGLTQLTGALHADTPAALLPLQRLIWLLFFFFFIFFFLLFLFLLCYVEVT